METTVSKWAFIDDLVRLDYIGKESLIVTKSTFNASFSDIINKPYDEVKELYALHNEKEILKKIKEYIDIFLKKTHIPENKVSDKNALEIYDSLQKLHKSLSNYGV